VVYDGERDSDLIRTLTVYFDCGENASEAADRLFLHRNSVPYRLERVRELTGLDYRDNLDRLALRLGLLALDNGVEKEES
jgi:purine catabolism regulator